MRIDDFSPNSPSRKLLPPFHQLGIITEAPYATQHCLVVFLFKINYFIRFSVWPLEAVLDHAGREHRALWPRPVAEGNGSGQGSVPKGEELSQQQQ